eukprot:scaffold479930_cov33-Prasinocladus_malaysianus.AAC.1
MGIALDVYVCAKLQQELEHWQHPFRRGNVGRRPDVVVSGVGIRPVLQKTAKQLFSRASLLCSALETA